MAAEKNFEEKIKRYLKENGCWFIKYWAGAAFTKSGIPDLLVCCNGFFLAIEVKASSGKPSLLQLYNVNKINESGGFAVVLYPEQFEQFKHLVECIVNDDIDYAKAAVMSINKRG